jgi:YggT family protein
MVLIGNLLLLALDIYFWIIIVSVVASWLIAFDVINTRNPQAANLMNLLRKATEPVYKPLRKFIPAIGGIDITPIIVIIGISIMRNIVIKLLIVPYY